MRQKRFISDIFIMSFKTKIFFRNNFKSLYEKTKNTKLVLAEQELYNRILYLCDWEDLLEWQTTVLEESYKKKKAEKGWFGFLSKGQKEVFTPEVFKENYSPYISTTLSTILNLTCSNIELKLATYDIKKILIQSQTLNFINNSINATLTEDFSEISFAVGNIFLNYSDCESKELVMKMSSETEQPCSMGMLKLFSDNKTQNEVKYVSQLLEIHANSKALSHLVNFVSLKLLSENKKKKIVDKLKYMQEKAMSQISNVFYYEKTYKVEFFSPCTKVFVPAENGVFFINLSNLSVSDRAEGEIDFYSPLYTSLQIEALFNELEIIPKFEIQLEIRTLNKIVLLQKWATKETHLDNRFDIEILGKIEEFHCNFYTSLINEFKFLEKTLKLYETNELVVLNKAKIMKDMEAVSAVELISGFYTQKCIAVLKNDSIYFFQDEKALKAFDFCVITGSSIQKTENEITLIRQTKTIKLKFSKEAFCKKWFSLLIIKVKGTAEETQLQKFEKPVLRYNFVIKNTRARVISNELTDLYLLVMNNHEIDATYNDFCMKFCIKTHSVSVKNHEKEDVFYFGNEDFEEKIDVSLFKRNSKWFKGQDVEIFVDFKAFHLFFSKSAFAQMMAFKESVVPKESPSEKVEQNIMKISFGYDISQIFVDFFKGVREVGRFELGNTTGQMMFEGSSAILEGALSSMKILWKEKKTNEYVSLLDLADNNKSSFSINYNKDLKIQTKIDSAHIFYTPGTVKSIKNYFSEITPASSSDPNIPSEHTEKNNTEIDFIIENFNFTAKKSYLVTECFQFCVVFARLITDLTIHQVELGQIEGNSDHELLKHSKSLITSQGSVTEISSEDVNLFFTSKDLHTLLNFYDYNPKAPNPATPAAGELELKLKLKNSSLHLLDKLDDLLISAPGISVIVHSTQRTLNICLAAPSLLCDFNKKPIINLPNHTEDLVFVEILSENYLIDIAPFEITYNQKFVTFIKEFIDTVLATEKSVQTAPVLVPVEYIISIPSISLKLNFNQAVCTLSTNLKLTYKVLHAHCLIELNDLNIIKYTQDSLFTLLENTKMNLNLSFEQSNYVLAFPEDIRLQANQQDLQDFYNFAMQDLPKSNSGTSELTLESYFSINFSVITFKLLTKFREDFLEVILLHNKFKGIMATKTEFDIASKLVLNYFSPLIQTYESLIEPLDFLIFYSSESLPTPLSNLSLSMPPNSQISICVTDTVLKDLYSRFYEPASQIQSFSIYNNTGNRIRIIYPDQSDKLIEDKDIVPVKPPNSNEYLSVAVQLGDAELILNRLPLYSQGIHQHQLLRSLEIVSQISIIGQTKQIKISSAIEIKNNTQEQFSVLFFENEGLEAITVKIIDPFCVVSVPLTCCKGKVLFLPPGTAENQCRKIGIAQIVENSPYCKSGDYSFLLHFEKPVIHIWPSLIIKNVLPTYISICLNDSNENIIQPNESKDFFVPPTKTSMFVTVNGFGKSAPVFIFVKKLSKAVPIKTEKFATEIGLICSEENCLRITLYPYFLILNLSMVPVSFHVQYKNSFVNISKDYRDNKYFIGKTQNLLVELENCFSCPLPIDSLAKKNFEICKHGQIFHFVHCTTVAKVPGEKKFTKVFHVYSKFVLTNFMDQDIRVMQIEADPKKSVQIKSGKSNYFNWMNYGIKFLMALRVDGVSSDWTGGFIIDKSNTFYLKIENSIQKFFVKVSVKDEDELVNVLFYNAYESDVRIVNKCSFAIQVYQTGSHLVEDVAANSEEYFAWYSQGLKEELAFKCKYLGSWQTFYIKFDTVGELQILEYPDNPNVFVYAMVNKEANTHLVTISEMPFEKCENFSPSLMVSAIFPKIFVSFIQHDIYMKKEIMLMTIFGFNFNLAGYGEWMDWKVEMTDVQIDSQIYEFVVCPIFFVTDGNDPLTLSGRIVSTSKWMCLENFHLDMKNLIINVDSNLLESVLNYYSRFISSTDTNLDHFLTSSTQAADALSGAWVFLSQLSVSSFVIKFSYKTLPTSVQDHFKAFLINFDDIIIFLEESHYHKLYGSPSTISYVISNTYKKMIMSNLDLILKQHGMMGGVFMFAVKASNGFAKAGKKSNVQVSKEAKVLYEEKLRQHRQNNTIRFTRCLKSEEMNQIAKGKEKSGIDSFADIVNNPVNGFLSLFKKKNNKKEEDENVVIKFKQRPNRVFYGRLSVIQPFDFDDCQSAGILRIKNNEFCAYFFYGQSIGTDYRTGKKIVAVVFDKVVVLMDDESRILWEINPICIEKIEKVKESLVVSGLDKVGKVVKLNVGFLEEDSVRKLEVLIKEVRKEMNSSS